MTEIPTDYYVQVNTPDGWWTVFKGTDKHLAAALAVALSRGWDAETCVLSAYALRRRHGGMEQIHTAENDLAELEDEMRAEIATLAEEAKETAEDALFQATSAKVALEVAERRLREAMVVAHECDYTLREIGAAVGLSGQRVHQMIGETVAAVA